MIMNEATEGLRERVRTGQKLTARDHVEISKLAGRDGSWNTLGDYHRVVAQIARVGQLPAGPMADRRTKRNRDRGSQRRAAIEDQR